MSDHLFGRQYSLIVTGPGGADTFTLDPVTGEGSTTGHRDTALDLSQLHFRFQIRAPEVETPNTATIRIYNPADTTAQLIQQEFSSVILQAGYQGGQQYGQIFKGDIKWVKVGRESNVTKYVEIDAADGDLAYLTSVVNTTLAAGAASPVQQANAVAASMSSANVTQGDTTPLTNGTGGIIARGKVLFGLARAYARQVAGNTGCVWSIQNGVLTWSPQTGYAPNEAVVLTARTGLIGMPEQTQNGIKIRCLLNPNIVVGGLVKIDNASINSTTVLSQGYPSYNNIALFADQSADGTYKVIVHEMVGDTRGEEWYSDLICLAVDTSASSGNQVKPNSGGGTSDGP
jgi:hypothetical protein